MRHLLSGTLSTDSAERYIPLGRQSGPLHGTVLSKTRRRLCAFWWPRLWKAGHFLGLTSTTGARQIKSRIWERDFGSSDPGDEWTSEHRSDVDLDWRVAARNGEEQRRGVVGLSGGGASWAGTCNEVALRVWSRTAPYAGPMGVRPRNLLFRVCVACRSVRLGR